MRTKQKCHLYIETKILSPSGIVEKIQLESAADWIVEENVLTVQYQEGDNEQAIFSHLQIHLGNHEVQLIRSGAVRFHHTFREGEVMESPYESPFGYLVYSSYTKQVQLEMNNGKPDIFILKYDSSFNDERVGEFTITHRFVDLVLPTQPVEH